MDEEIDGSTNEASKDGNASDQIISDVAAPPCEREASSGSNDAHQDKTKECITSPSCFTMDDRSSQIDPLVGTSSKVHNELIHVEPLIDTISSQSFSPNRGTSIDAKQRTTTMDCGTFFGVCGSRKSNNGTNETVNMGDHLRGRCTTGATFPTSSNKLAMWRARQKANETEEEKQARLNKERDAKSNQRQKRYRNELLNERILRQEQAAVTKAQQRHIRDLNETDETHETRMNYEASRKNISRNVQHMQESDDDRRARLIQEGNAKKQHRDNRDVQETGDMRHERLDYQTEREKIRRLNRDLQETEDM